MSFEPSETNVIVYHHPCNDGTIAAALAWLALPQINKTIDFIRMEAGRLPKSLGNTTNRNILFLDCVPHVKEYFSLKLGGNNILILDHHASNRSLTKELSANLCQISETQSACSLAYDFFGIAKIDEDRSIAKFIQLVEAKDLNSNVMLPDSEYLYHAIQHRLKNIYLVAHELSIICSLFPQLDKLLEEGKELTAKKIEETEKAYATGRLVYVVDAEDARPASDMFKRAKIDYGVHYLMLNYKTKDGDGNEVNGVALRSDEEDVAKIAMANGGGGHKQAAGYIYYTQSQMLQAGTIDKDN